MSGYQELISELRNTVKSSPGLGCKDSEFVVESSNESAGQIHNIRGIIRDFVRESPGDPFVLPC